MSLLHFGNSSHGTLDRRKQASGNICTLQLECGRRLGCKVLGLPVDTKQSSGRRQGMQASLEFFVLHFRRQPSPDILEARLCPLHPPLLSAGLPAGLHTAMAASPKPSSSAAASTGIWAEGLLRNKVAIVTGAQPSHASPPMIMA